MEQVSQWRALLEDLSREAFYEMEREDREFLDPLQHWVNRLVQRTLPIDWRGQLHAYLAPWEARHGNRIKIFRLGVVPAC